MKLWVNESFRVFHDRLISDEDRTRFKDYVLELISRNFRWLQRMMSFGPNSGLEIS